MQFKEYIERNCINKLSFARKAGLTPPIIYRAMKGLNLKLISALKISQATDYAVSVEELAPKPKKD